MSLFMKMKLYLFQNKYLHFTVNFAYNEKTFIKRIDKLWFSYYFCIKVLQVYALGKREGK